MPNRKKDAMKAFVRELKKSIDAKRVYTDELRRLAWGADAGFYHLIPQVVVRAKDREEVSMILRMASDYNLPVTFRAAGTSLSGQAISDSILIVAGKNWEGYEISDDTSTITLQPGRFSCRSSTVCSMARTVVVISAESPTKRIPCSLATRSTSC